MNIETCLGSFSETAVVYRYLDLLAGRVAVLEQRAALNEIKSLRQENKRLRERLEQQEEPDMEQLLVFLPVLFRNFWSTVQPADLALLAGTLDVPHVPSPCPEPSPETISRMKRELMQMSESKRAQLMAFCQKLPHQLTMRSEMRALLEREA